ncbi:prephenate dehydratase domain-containing protein [Gammaproteobacteria bacterium AB-CW1]|uniref:prephenate dehydratase n=1 Tax=Natronospira elongata TaxID=3110268 RepID=A0AAP6JIU7_9GAMM|nr:prephenate dehydratase domain-containing protein [Gammaproteobacteria bacterium AB-CW1]
MKTVIIQGGPASYSAQAAKVLLAGELRFIHARSFEAAIEHYLAQAGSRLLFPWWNSTIGPIGPVQRLYRQHELRMQNSLSFPIHHCLIGWKPRTPRTRGTVLSHPAALSQCQAFLRRNPWLKAQASHDTADSVALLRETRPVATLAIASAHAAAHYGMPVLERNIQDSPTNRTRFILTTAAP